MKSYNIKGKVGKSLKEELDLKRDDIMQALYSDEHLNTQQAIIRVEMLDSFLHAHNYKTVI